MAGTIGWAVRDRQAQQALANATTSSVLNGIALYKLRRLDEAEVAFNEAIRLNPNLAEPRFQLGMVLAEKGLRDQAISSFQAAIRLQPDFDQAYAYLGQLLREKGRFTEAISNYQEAIRIGRISSRPITTLELCSHISRCLTRPSLNTEK